MVKDLAKAGNTANHRTLYLYSCTPEDRTESYHVQTWFGDENQYKDREDVDLKYVKDPIAMPCDRAKTEKTFWESPLWKNELGGIPVKWDPNHEEWVKIDQTLNNGDHAIAECSVKVGDWPVDVAVLWYFGESDDEDRGIFYQREGEQPVAIDGNVVEIKCTGDHIV